RAQNEIDIAEMRRKRIEREKQKSAETK
ncbi:MAG: hypothetical protein RL693_1046, partial [Verrucomicrobiota bacterium]